MRRSLLDRLNAAFHFTGYWTVKVMIKYKMPNVFNIIFKNRVQVLSYRNCTNRNCTNILLRKFSHIKFSSVDAVILP